MNTRTIRKNLKININIFISRETKSIFFISFISDTAVSITDSVMERKITWRT
jgi:hypothetical protein